MKGEIIEITKVVNEAFQESYQVAIKFEELPKLILGDAEVTQ